MERSAAIRQRLAQLFAVQHLGVVATVHQGQPYASLVAFAATDDLRHLVFATPRTTRKFTYLQAEPRVAILINDSRNQVDDFHQAAAVTAVGRCTFGDAADMPDDLALYLSKHPHLADFVRSPTTALVRVTVSRYILVRNFQHVVELHMDP